MAAACALLELAAATGIVIAIVIAIVIDIDLFLGSPLRVLSYITIQSTSS